MLIDILWESLDEERIREIETRWANESEERIDAVDRDELETVDGPSAITDLRRFPFGLIYQIRIDEILIVSVMDLRADPTKWKDLLRDEFKRAR